MVLNIEQKEWQKVLVREGGGSGRLPRVLGRPRREADARRLWVGA